MMKYDFRVSKNDENIDSFNSSAINTPIASPKNKRSSVYKLQSPSKIMSAVSNMNNVIDDNSCQDISPRRPSLMLSPLRFINDSHVSNRNSIKVIARFRPENDAELKMAAAISDEFGTSIDNNLPDLIDFQTNTSCLFRNKEQLVPFTFDRIFPPDSTQEDLYNYSISETVKDIFEGYNGAILAYGQTGSGKTYTMMGSSIDDDSQKGLIPRIVDTIFDYIASSSSDIEYTVGVSYMEIYMEKIRDLLDTSNKNKLIVQEDKDNGVHVKGLQCFYVSSSEELYELMKQGSNARAVASTNMNQESSRSHSIFQIVITQKITSSGIIKKGNLFLVDLAGSEKVNKTGASGQTLEEAKKINSSLSSLGHVINALTDDKATHVPYRDSKLTRILQESLGGNSRTSLIINCSPSLYNAAETLSTLRFGARAKKIKNKAHVNAELSPKELKRKLAESVKQNKEKNKAIALLMEELKKWRDQIPPSPSQWIVLDYINNVDGNDFLSDLNNNNNIDRTNPNELNFVGKNILNDLSDSSLLLLENNANDTFYLHENYKLKEELKGTQKLLAEQNSQLVKLDALKEKDTIINSQRSEIDYLKSQLDIEKLANSSLVNDIKEKTNRYAALDLEMESLKGQLKKRVISKTDKKKLLDLERSLEQIAHKLDDMVLQNHILKKDISTTKKIAETRGERIKTLENMVREQQLFAQKESSSFEKRLQLLGSRLNNFKKYKNEETLKIDTASIVNNIDGTTYNMGSPTMNLFKMGHAMKSPSTSSPSTMFTQLQASQSEKQDLKAVADEDNQAGTFENDEKNDEPLTIRKPTIAELNGLSDSEIEFPEVSGSKRGLNFRIVKPLRGGVNKATV